MTDLCDCDGIRIYSAHTHSHASFSLADIDKYVPAECYTDDTIEIIDDKTPLAQIVGDLAVETDKLPFIGVTMNDPDPLWHLRYISAEEYGFKVHGDDLWDAMATHFKHLVSLGMKESTEMDFTLKSPLIVRVV